MKKQFQFKLLRFVPDSFSGEFINLGVVLFCPEPFFLKARFTNRLSRISALFQGQNLDGLRRMLVQLEAQINGLNQHLEPNPPRFTSESSIDDLLYAIYPPSINVLQWAPSQGFLGASNPDVELEAMYQRTIGKYETGALGNKSVEAERAARLPYWNHFERLGIAKNLRKHEVDVVRSKIRFEHAWKNGNWHAYEELPLTIIKKESAQDRINSWVGKIKLLSHAGQSIKIHFLTPEGASPDLIEMAQIQLITKTEGLESILVTPEEAAAFAERVQREMELSGLKN